VVVGAWADDDGGDSSGSAYIFARNTGGADNWGEVTKLTASDAAPLDIFGDAVAIDGDTVVVIAQGLGKGIYVFERNKGGADGWGQVVKLASSVGHIRDTVAISGNTIIAGDVFEDGGVAFLFERNAQGMANSWGQVAQLKVSGSNQFAASVGISDDTVIVGDPRAATLTGEAHLFTRTGDEWAEVSKAVATDAAANDQLGYAVAINGDTVVLGAPLNDDAGSESGSAYIFERNTNGIDAWGEVVKISASDAGAGDQFGFAVGINGDTVVIGAPFDDDDGSDSGAAYVFERNTNGADSWGQVNKLTASDADIGDQFGFSVGISMGTVVVGAPFDDDFSNGSGSAYIFARNKTGMDGWGQVAKLTANDPGAGADANFGISVDISLDKVVVGAHLANVGTKPDAGSAYIFARNKTGMDGWGQVAKLTAIDGARNDEFGRAVAISGDTVLVGAYLDNHSAGSAGSAYIFERNEGGSDIWGQVAKLTTNFTEFNAQFGISVGLSGDTAVVGAHLANDGGSLDTGAAYIFERNTGGAENWGEVAQLLASDAAQNDQLGYAVDISMGTVVAGAWGDDDAGAESGAACIFDRRDAFAKTITGVGSLTLGGDTNVSIDLTSSACGTTTFTMVPTYSNHPNATPNLQTEKYWTLTSSCAGAFSLDLTVGTTFVPESDDKVCRYTGSEMIWDCAASSFDAGNKTITRNGVTTLSDWAAQQATLTAVELAAFNATALADGIVEVSWETAVESDNAGFNVYRSSIASFDDNAERINNDLIAAQGSLGQGASYSLIDSSAVTGVSYYFLEDVDYNGVHTLHGPVMVDTSTPTAVGLTSVGGSQSSVAMLAVALAVLFVFLSMKWHLSRRV
jgi:hypothetical protein